MTQVITSVILSVVKCSGATVDLLIPAVIVSGMPTVEVAAYEYV